MTAIIRSVETGCYLIPLPHPLSDSTHGEITHFAFVTARVRDEDGAEGLGYTYTVGPTGSAAVHAILARDLAPWLVGQPADDIGGIWERMWWRLHWVGRGGVAAFAMAAADIALWDLRCRRAGQPLWRLLGGTSNRVPCYAGGIDLHLTPENLVAQAEGFLKQGFTAIKMKAGRPDLAEDVARLRAMRSYLGSDFPLMVDANMRWSVDEAVRAASAFAEYHPYWLEEPTLPEDVDGHARIAKEGGVPLAAGENLHTLYEFEQMIARGGLSFPEPDCANLGGITPWLRVARIAAERGLPVTTHGVHDLHVHLLAAIPNPSYLEVHGFGLERFMAHPLRIEGGAAYAPERPGHGVELDWDALEAHRASV